MCTELRLAEWQAISPGGAGDSHVAASWARRIADGSRHAADAETCGADELEAAQVADVK